MEGLPREVQQASACRELARVTAAEASTPVRGRTPTRCFSCHRAWFAAGLPAVVKSSEGGTTRWDCSCCGAYRVMSAEGHVVSQVGIEVRP